MALPSDPKLPNSVAQILLREDQGGVATLTINRPAARNALSMEFLNSLQSELDAISSDASVKVLILKEQGQPSVLDMTSKKCAQIPDALLSSRYFRPARA